MSDESNEIRDPKSHTKSKIIHEKRKLLEEIREIEQKISLLNLGINDKLRTIGEEWIYEGIDIDFLLEKREKLIIEFETRQSTKFDI
jgi:hypothetical protein